MQFAVNPFVLTPLSLSEHPVGAPAPRDVPDHLPRGLKGVLERHHVHVLLHDDYYLNIIMIRIQTTNNSGVHF